MNTYHQDSIKFFQFVSQGIQPVIGDFQVIQLVLNFALGVERLLKGILFDVNPTFILVEPGFKHSIQTLYYEKIIEESKKTGELAADPNKDVITFRNSLLRVQHISKVCYDNKNTLFSLSNARDIIVHNELQCLDVAKLRNILQKDFYLFLKQISEEIDITKDIYFNGHQIRLSKLSSSLQSDLTQKINLLIEAHKEIWMKQKGMSGYFNDKLKVTANILSNSYNERTSCPACNNDAVIYLNPINEISPTLRSNILIGFEVIKLKCQFCKLEIADYSILDDLGIRDRSLVLCSRCNLPIKDSSNDLCDSCNDFYGTEN